MSGSTQSLAWGRSPGDCACRAVWLVDPGRLPHSAAAPRSVGRLVTSSTESAFTGGQEACCISGLIATISHPSLLYLNSTLPINIALKMTHGHFLPGLVQCW